VAKDWTSDEIRFLKANYAALGRDGVARRIGRTPGACHKRAMQYRLTKRKPPRTPPPDFLDRARREVAEKGRIDARAFAESIHVPVWAVSQWLAAARKAGDLPRAFGGYREPEPGHTMHAGPCARVVTPEGKAEIEGRMADEHALKERAWADGSPGIVRYGSWSVPRAFGPRRDHR
jgi:hypothetical protein